MLLVIDAGNTNIVFAVYDGWDQRAQWRTATDSRRTADEYVVWLTQLMVLEGLEPRDIRSSVMSNVVPATMDALRRLCSRYFGGAPLVVGDPGVELGIEVRIDRPEQVGADRLANTVAAHRRYPGAKVVVDFGTATSFDVVAADGAYEGDVIAPGIHLSMEALYMAAAKLPRVAVERPPRVIGKATVPAMQSGVYWGYVGLIEGLLQRIEAEHGSPLTVIATGGLADLFSEAIPAIAHVDPDLTLDGLVAIDELNRGGGGGGDA